MSYPYQYYSVPPTYYQPTNWTPPPGQPTSAPPSSGGANAIQFGSLHPNQVEALQYSHPATVYSYGYPVQMMSPYGYQHHPHSQMPHPAHAQQMHGVQPQREMRGRHDRQQRPPGRNSHPPRDRSTDQRGESGHREPLQHHKPPREGAHGQPQPLSRAGTPTPQQQPQQQQQQQQPQQQSRETTTGHHHHPNQMSSGGYSSQSGPMTMTMHPASHFPPHTYYYPPHYAPHGYHMPPPNEVPPTEPAQPYHPKTSSKLPFEHGPQQPPYVHPGPHTDGADASPKPTPAVSSKKRLNFINPQTQNPIDYQDNPNLNQVEKPTTGLPDSEGYASSRPTSRPTSPAPKEVEQTVREVMKMAELDKPTSKLLVSKVQDTVLKTGDSFTTKQTNPRAHPKREGKVFIDPSNGSFVPGSLNSNSTSRPVQTKPNESRTTVDTSHMMNRREGGVGIKGRAAEVASLPSPQIKEPTPSVASDVLRTVASVERHQGEKRWEVKAAELEEVKVPVQPKETVETVKALAPLILTNSKKSAQTVAEAVADIVTGSRAVAANGAAEKHETDEQQQQQPKSHPVVVKANPPPSASDTSKEQERVTEVTETEEDVIEMKEEREPTGEHETEKELAAIAVQKEATQDVKPDTPSKNVYSPSVMQEFKEKNKEPLPDMGTGPWLESSDVDSPSQKERLPRRNSSGKLGSRSNSYQTLSRRNSTSNKASRQSKSDPDEVFHVSSKNRIYSVEYLMGMKTQFTERPNLNENLQCMKDADVGKINRAGSDRWSKPGRSAYDGKPSLNRSGSGRDWQQKEGNRSGNMSSNRRLMRVYSGQRGADDGKWSTSPFVTRSPEMELHHTKERYVVGEMQTDDPEEEKRQKTFKGVLNKLTPSNFARMYQKFKEVEIVDPKTLKGLIDQIFDKALTETTFCPLYSDLCKLLTSEMPEFEEEGDKRKLTFRRLLLNKCQNEFEKGDAAVRAAEEAEAADDSVMSAEERQARLNAAKKERMRSLGNMQFIGFLFKKGMLTERIIHNCIVDLLSEEVNPKPEDIECLCQLLATVGGLLKSQENVLDAYFLRINRLSTHQKLETRHRFMLLDLIELKDRKWVERHEKEGPKKIEEIHRDAQMEQMNQNARNRNSGYSGNYNNRSSRGGTGWSRTTSAATRPVTTYNTHEEVKPLTRNLSLGRTASSDISLRPSSIGGPKVAVVSMPRPRSRSPTNPPPVQTRIEESETEETRNPPMDGDVLRRKVKSLLTEYYDVKDLEEAIRCIEELIAENAQTSDILKNMLLTALDIRKVSVDDRLKPVSPLLQELLSRKIFATQDAKKGLQITMAALPEVTDDFPIAPTLIARMLGTLVSEGTIPLKPILDPVNGIILGAGKDSVRSDDEDTMLVSTGIASQILIDLLKQMKSEEKADWPVRKAVDDEKTDLLLFYPSDMRDNIDLSQELQFLD